MTCEECLYEWAAVYPVSCERLECPACNHMNLVPHDPPMNINCLYILDKNKRPVSEHDAVKWVQWMSLPERIVSKTTHGDVSVSTVFLGLDHAYGGGVPILWETMIFGGKHDQYQKRCSGGWEQAEAMHAETVRMAFGSDDAPELNG